MEEKKGVNIVINLKQINIVSKPVKNIAMKTNGVNV